MFPKQNSNRLKTLVYKRSVVPETMEEVKNELLGLPLRRSTGWLESPRLPPASHLPQGGFTCEANRESVPLGFPPAPAARPSLAGCLVPAPPPASFRARSSLGAPCAPRQTRTESLPRAGRRVPCPRGE